MSGDSENFLGLEELLRQFISNLPVEDQLGLYTLAQLYTMNGSKFPFSAMKMRPTDGYGQVGGIITCLADLGDGDYRIRTSPEGATYASAHIPSYIFADEDFTGDHL